MGDKALPHLGFGQGTGYRLEEFRRVGSPLGQGSYGEVAKVYHKRTRDIFAMKIIPKVKILENQMVDYVSREIQTQLKLTHPNILKLHDIFEDEECVHLLLEYASGGSLFSLLKRRGTLPEPEAAGIFAGVVSALIHLHGRGILHRDIKPENILLCEDGTAKLADFGWCNEQGRTSVVRNTFCGTLDYLSPEMIRDEPHDFTIDVWAIGVLLYEMLIGASPFKASSQMQSLLRISTVDLKMPDTMPAKAGDLISRLLVNDRTQRLSLAETSQHEWVRQHLGTSAATHRLSVASTGSADSSGESFIEDVACHGSGGSVPVEHCSPETLHQEARLSLSDEEPGAGVLLPLAEEPDEDDGERGALSIPGPLTARRTPISSSPELVPEMVAAPLSARGKPRTESVEQVQMFDMNDKDPCTDVSCSIEKSYNALTFMSAAATAERLMTPRGEALSPRKQRVERQRQTSVAEIPAEPPPTVKPALVAKAPEEASFTPHRTSELQARLQTSEPLAQPSGPPTAPSMSPSGSLSSSPSASHASASPNRGAEEEAAAQARRRCLEFAAAAAQEAEECRRQAEEQLRRAQEEEQVRRRLQEDEERRRQERQRQEDQRFERERARRQEDVYLRQKHLEEAERKLRDEERRRQREDLERRERELDEAERRLELERERQSESRRLRQEVARSPRSARQEKKSPLGQVKDAMVKTESLLPLHRQNIQQEQDANPMPMSHRSPQAHTPKVEHELTPEFGDHAPLAGSVDDFGGKSPKMTWQQTDEFRKIKTWLTKNSGNLGRLDEVGSGSQTARAVVDPCALTARAYHTDSARAVTSRAGVEPTAPFTSRDRLSQTDGDIRRYQEVRANGRDESDMLSPGYSWRETDEYWKVNQWLQQSGVEKDKSASNLLRDSLHAQRGRPDRGPPSASGTRPAEIAPPATAVPVPPFTTLMRQGGYSRGALTARGAGERQRADALLQTVMQAPSEPSDEYKAVREWVLEEAQRTGRGAANLANLPASSSRAHAGMSPPQVGFAAGTPAGVDRGGTRDAVRSLPSRGSIATDSAVSSCDSDSPLPDTHRRLLDSPKRLLDHNRKHQEKHGGFIAGGFSSPARSGVKGLVPSIPISAALAGSTC